MGGFVAEGGVVEHGCDFEDGVGLGFYSDCIRQILADGDDVCISVDLIFEYDLHADAEDGSGVCFN